MKYFVDGFTISKNPSPSGGGYSVMDGDGNLLMHKKIYKPNFTNNEGEILAISWAAAQAEMFDEIITDSKCARIWALAGFAGARPDLNAVCAATLHDIEEKHLEVVWCPREQNLAGLYNEKPKTYKF